MSPVQNLQKKWDELHQLIRGPGFFSPHNTELSEELQHVPCDILSL